MASEEINRIQVEINAKLEKLKTVNNPAERRELILALKKLFTEIDRLEASWK